MATREARREKREEITNKGREDTPIKLTAKYVSPWDVSNRCISAEWAASKDWRHGSKTTTDRDAQRQRQIPRETETETDTGRRERFVRSKTSGSTNSRRRDNGSTSNQ